MKVQPRPNTIGLQGPQDPSVAAPGAAPKSAGLAADDASGPPEFLKYANRPPLPQGAGATESIEDCYAARKLLRELTGCVESEG